jgi:hypothetical protein
LEKYCTQHIPDQSTLRKHYLPICYEETLGNIKGNIGDAFTCIWVAADETIDPVDRFITNLVAGKLDIEVPPNPDLTCYKVLYYTYHSTVAIFVNNGLKLFWPTGIHEERALIFYSDAAANMLKAATALKVLCPNLIHFTCVAHGLQRVAEEIRTKFLQVYKLISMSRKVFLKAPYRVQAYKQRLPDVLLPPPPTQCQQDGKPG